MIYCIDSTAPDIQCVDSVHTVSLQNIFFSPAIICAFSSSTCQGMSLADSQLPTVMYSMTAHSFTFTFPVHTFHRSYKLEYKTNTLENHTWHKMEYKDKYTVSCDTFSVTVMCFFWCLYTLSIINATFKLFTFLVYVTWGLQFVVLFITSTFNGRNPQLSKSDQ